MADHNNWRSTANILPDNHIRIEFDTTRSVEVRAVVNFAERVSEYLAEMGFEEIQLIHAGRGSTVFEFSVEEQQAYANLEKTKAETRLANAKSRSLNVTTLGLLTPLLLAALTVGEKMISGTTDLSVMASTIADQGKSEICRILVGESCIEFNLPLEYGDAFPPNADHESIDQLKARAGDDTMIAATFEIWLPEDSGPLSVRRVEMPAHHENSTTSFGGIVVNGDSTLPSIQAEKENFVLHGLNTRLGIEDGTRVAVEAKAGFDGKLYPTKIRILDYTAP